MAAGGVSRVTVSVPAGLKERMDQLAGRANWSLIAGAAFEQEVRRLSVEEEPSVLIRRAIENLIETKKFSQAAAAQALEEIAQTLGRSA